MVVNKLGILAAGVVVKAVFARSDVVVYVAVDALVEETGLYVEPCVAVSCTHNRLVTALAGQVSVAHHPVRAFLQADGIKLIDVWRTPRPSDVCPYVPVVVYLVMACKAGREVAVKLKVVVVGVVAQAGVAVNRHHAEVVTHAQRHLQPSPFGLVQEVASHRKGGEVGHEGRLFCPWVVVVGLVSVGKACVGGHLPQLPLGMPKHVYLVGFKDEVLYGYPTPLRFLAVFKLLAQVFLEREGEINLMAWVKPPFHFAFQGDMLRLLEGRFYLVREGLDGLWVGPAILKSFHQLVQVAHFTGIVDAATLIINAGEERGGDVFSLKPHHTR